MAENALDEAVLAAAINPVVGEIETFLRQIIADLKPAPRPSAGRGRPAILPSLCLWAGLLVCVLRGFSSQLALWRLLYLGQLPSALALAPFAAKVVALDQTTLDQIARRLPSLRQVPSGDDRLLPAKLSALFDLRRQQWQKIEYTPDPHQNEKVAARQMVLGLPIRNLIVADLGYFGFEWFDWLTDQNYWWVSRLRAKTSFKLLHTFYCDGETRDQLIWLGAYRSDQAAHAVRLVQFRVGTTRHRYITNVTVPQTLPLIEIARLYARRWDIELAFKTIKQHLGLHLLWSAKTTVILQQVWATLIIAQILQALQMELAQRAGVDVFEVSLALMLQYLPQFAYTGLDPLTEFLRYGREVRFIRPSTRTKIVAPEPPFADYLPTPADLVLQRERRYAHKT